jgi:hypothetical protein
MVYFDHGNLIKTYIILVSSIKSINYQLFDEPGIQEFDRGRPVSGVARRFKAQAGAGPALKRWGKGKERN